MEQLLAHLVGDYILQTDSMAKYKCCSFAWALIHGAVYTLPFLLITHSWNALWVIWLSHAVIDRWRLARYVIMAKNYVTASSYERETRVFHTSNGAHVNMPEWMAFWLLIIADNTIHLCINYAAIRWL